jgi:hypothetical protein
MTHRVYLVDVELWQNLGVHRLRAQRHHRGRLRHLRLHLRRRLLCDGRDGLARRLGDAGERAQKAEGVRLFLQPQQGAVHLVAREAVAAAHPHDAAALVIAVADAQRLERARQRRLQPPARRVRQQDGKREREALRVVLALHLLLARLRHVWCRS